MPDLVLHSQLLMIIRKVGSSWSVIKIYQDSMNLSWDNIMFCIFFSMHPKVGMENLNVNDGSVQGVFWVTRWGHQCQLHVTRNGGNWWSNVGQLNLRKDLHSLKLLPVFVACYGKQKWISKVNMKEFELFVTLCLLVYLLFQHKFGANTKCVLSLRLQLFNFTVTKVGYDWQVLILNLMLHKFVTETSS
jgi:hypothetical protein